MQALPNPIMFPENCRATRLIEEDRYFELFEMLPPVDFTESASLCSEAVTYTNQGEIIRTMITALTKDDSTEIHATADVTLKEWGLLKNITTVDEWNEQIAALPPLDAICPDN